MLVERVQHAPERHVTHRQQRRVCRDHTAAAQLSGTSSRAREWRDGPDDERLAGCAYTCTGCAQPAPGPPRRIGRVASRRAGRRSGAGTSPETLAA